LGLNLLPVGWRGKLRLHHRAIHACLFCGGDENGWVADILPLLEIEAEKIADQAALYVFARATSPTDHPMRIERVRRALYGFEVEFDARGGTELTKPVVSGVDALAAAEFRQHVALSLQPLRRDCRVELEGAPAHRHVDI